MITKAHVGVLILLVAGCAEQSPCDRSYVSQGIKSRTAYELGRETQPGQFNLPEGVSLDDGLSEDEAVAIALWNNAHLQADLAALGFARADLIEANMLANPVFSLLFPVGPKLFEAKLNVPMDVLWQRPHRIAAAKLDARSLSERLIEHGLGLIRDVQTTYAELWLAQERARMAEENAQLRLQMAELAHAQLRAGDLSELATSGAHVDALRAVAVAKSLSEEAATLRHRLNTLLGFVSDEAQFDIVPSDTVPTAEMPIDELLKTALVARPDLRAAELAIEAAGERLGWEQSKIYNFIAVIDAKDKGGDSLNVGPGFSVEIPILNQNDGRIARAKAEMEQAARQYEAVRQDILLQVRQACTQYVLAREELELWNKHIVPSLEEAFERTEKSLAVGEASYLSVLEAEGKLVEARIQQTQWIARLHRTVAELNYRVGKKMM